MTLENQVNSLASQIENLDASLIDISDRLSMIDDSNIMVQSFLVAERENDDHLDLMNAIGIKISGKIHTTANVNYPTGIKVFEPGKPWMISYYQRLTAFTEEYTIDKVFPHTYHNPKEDSEGIAYSFGFDVDQEGGNFAICSYARHICRVYNKEGKLLFTIGKVASAGNVADEKLYYPIHPQFLPNGNILILSYYGFGKGATNHGHLSEYSGKDGSFVATRLGFYGDGQSKIGTNHVYRPMALDIDKKDPNLLWITEYTRGRVLVINMKTWLTEEIYYPPADYNFTNSYGVACLSDGNFAIASNVQGSIMIVDRKTKEVLKEIDVLKVGASPDFRDLKELKPGYLIFTSWTSQGAFVTPTADTTEISYSQSPLPVDAALIPGIQFPSYDPSTGILTRGVNDLDDVPAKLVVPYSKNLP